jgi:hypothetical protein
MRNFAGSNKKVMETKTKNRTISATRKPKTAPKRLSKTAEFWLKYPNGVISIIDHKAVLK